MRWSRKKIEAHQEAAGRLSCILREAIEYIKENDVQTTELGVVKFISNRIAQSGMRTSGGKPIVAIRENTANVHYFANKKTDLKLDQSSLIMIDLWARLDEPRSPFADITWMAYFGRKVPKEYDQKFELVRVARDRAVRHIKDALKKKETRTGLETHRIVEEEFEKEGVNDRFLHTTGHSLGFISPHGRQPGISRANPDYIYKNLGYTIEPGLYFKNFGVRSELDFYIDDDWQLVITTPVQEKIELI